jgi:hypothetical protein
MRGMTPERWGCGKVAVQIPAWTFADNSDSILGLVGIFAQSLASVIFPEQIFFCSIVN